MSNPDGSVSCYFFDADDNLLFLPTKLYLWNAENRSESAVDSGEFARIQNDLGRRDPWLSWSAREETFRDFRDQPHLPAAQQTFVRDLTKAIGNGTSWQGPSWPLLVHAAKNQRPIAIVTARGHDPTTIEAGLQLLVARGLLAGIPPILGIYTVTNATVRARLGITDPSMTVPSIKKIAIQHAVEVALRQYGRVPPHRFGMSDDDPNNVMLAISAMRACKIKYPDKRFFVVNTNEHEFVKLEVFPMDHPVTASPSGSGVLQQRHTPRTSGGNASIYVSDMDRSIEFYTTKLEMLLRARVADEWAELDAGNGLIIGLHPARPPETPEPGTIGAINIELAVGKELEEVVNELKAAAVSFKGEIQNYRNVRLATLLDPDGNGIVLAQQLEPQQGP
jgi:catechol 2,3-dioxygenase-like lactoylglutathione lyase family enzyme